MKNLGIVLALSIGLLANAQNGDGTIMGYVYSEDGKTTIPFAQVWVDYNGSVLGVTTDLKGKYKIQAIKPGKYNLHAKATLSGEKTMNGINVYPESISKQNIVLTQNKLLQVVTVVSEPLIKVDHLKTIPLDLIKNSPNIQDPKRLVADNNSDIQINSDNQMIIRGSRPGDVVYLVDGVKQRDMQSVPGVSIGSMAVYTGGIPAKYGDTMGGVVIMNTKGYFDLYYAWKAR